MPRTLSALLLIVATAALPLGLAACKTDTAGVKSNRLQQYTTVQATPPEVADAAAQVLQEMDLRNVQKQATSVDGVVRAQTARGDEIEVSIEREGQNTSEVTVWIGKLGDPDLGQDILQRLRQRLDRISS
jgi:uncharacterized protein YcbX